MLQREHTKGAGMRDVLDFREIMKQFAYYVIVR
jgi:hypothetical protein